MTDAVLIKKLRMGEETAYEMLFKQYYEQLVMFALKYIGDLDAARELVQDLYVSLYDKREQIRIYTSLKAYLYRSVRNKCINQLNSYKIQGKYEDFIKHSSARSSETIEQNIHKNEVENAIMHAIDKLPPKCKAIFMMNRFDGLSNSEIADKLSISKRTVETQISKALRLLRTELKPYLANVGVVILCLLTYFI